MATLVKITKINGKRPFFTRYIGRKVKNTEFTEDSVWANPYRVEDFDSVHECCVKYKEYILEMIKSNPVKYDITDLIGEILGCWCCTTESFKPPYRCHGQPLMEIIDSVKKKMIVHKLIL